MLTRSDFITLAIKQKGKKYILGKPVPYKGAAPAAFDCSGLACWLFAQSGNDVGDNTAASLYTKSKAVNSPATGDLVFRATNPKRYKGIGHVAVLLYPMTNGDWAVIEARGSKYGVVLTTLSDWTRKSDYAGLRRIPSFKLAAESAFRLSVAVCPLQSVKFGGPKNIKDVASAIAKINADIFICTETTLDSRKAISKALGSAYSRDVHSALTLTIFYRNTKLFPRKRRTADFGDKYHGAFVTPFGTTTAKNNFDLGAIHNLPLDVAKTEKKKLEMIAKAKTLIGTWPTIFGGDFALNADKVMQPLKRVSGVVDTYDKAGDQYIDALYADSRLRFISTAVIDPGKLSDHKWTLTVMKING